MANYNSTHTGTQIDTSVTRASSGGAIDTAINGKQSKLTTAQTNAVNSGITSSKVSKYDAYESEIDSKQDALPEVVKDRYLHTNAITGNLEWKTGIARGTDDYNDLINKPTLNGHTIEGDLTNADLDIDIEWGHIGGTLSDQTDLNTALDGKLDKDTSTTTYAKAYVKNADGTQGSVNIDTEATASSIARRTSTGAVKTATPTVDTHATPKKYVDDADATKLDKVTGATTFAQAYVKDIDGTQTMVDVSSANMSNKIIQRNSNGNASVSDPTVDSHIATKKYVDDQVATKSSVTGQTDGTNWTQLTIDGTTHAIGSGGGGTVAWGGITGTMSNQTDLVNALAGKLDKVTSTSSVRRVYGIKTDGTQEILAYTDSAVQATMMYRGVNGTTSVGTPTADAHATTKKYVDDAVAGVTLTLYRHNIKLKSSSANVMFSYDSSSSTPITTASALYDILGANNEYTASGGVMVDTIILPIHSIQGNTATSYYINYSNDDDGFVEEDKSIDYSSSTITDNVYSIS